MSILSSSVLLFREPALPLRVAKSSKFTHFCHLCCGVALMIIIAMVSDVMPKVFCEPADLVFFHRKKLTHCCDVLAKRGACDGFGGFQLWLTFQSEMPQAIRSYESSTESRWELAKTNGVSSTTPIVDLKEFKKPIQVFILLVTIIGTFRPLFALVSTMSSQKTLATLTFHFGNHHSMAFLARHDITYDLLQYRTHAKQRTVFVK